MCLCVCWVVVGGYLFHEGSNDTFYFIDFVLNLVRNEDVSQQGGGVDLFCWFLF